MHLSPSTPRARLALVLDLRTAGAGAAPGAAPMRRQGASNAALRSVWASPSIFSPDESQPQNSAPREQTACDKIRKRRKRAMSDATITYNLIQKFLSTIRQAATWQSTCSYLYVLARKSTSFERMRIRDFSKSFHDFEIFTLAPRPSYLCVRGLSAVGAPC